ncbi:hypothetical protein QE152_g10754 [Popillia japonica]|uniref:Uncharacterized protein n=1 Tax=Popillia japonica TaxID=7064 RepID=A0AAW1LUM4_POPJA
MDDTGDAKEPVNDNSKHVIEEVLSKDCRKFVLCYEKKDAKEPVNDNSKHVIEEVLSKDCRKFVLCYEKKSAEQDNDFASALLRHAIQNNSAENEDVESIENNLAEDENVQERLSVSLDNVEAHYDELHNAKKRKHMWDSVSNELGEKPNINSPHAVKIKDEYLQGKMQYKQQKLQLEERKVKALEELVALRRMK